ncbi:hypothetical protein AWW66_12975 [Micromonospora rosaria]|uniref:Condensation domain-containing protein n=2 Tax=Micromonospora rosaria TaxID=47874 RepID=A0A136PT54_9ACTN|nr:hypothetical protein AWW66_12975 [Micromonospora rosaria]
MWRANALSRSNHLFMNLRRTLAVSERVAADLASVTRAVGALVARHASLRTRVRPGGDGLRQETAPAGAMPLLVVPGEGDGHEAAQATATRLGDVAFDHADEWPVRIALVLVADRVRQIVLVFSHSTVDAHAVDIVLRDLRLLLLRGALRTPAGPQSVRVAQDQQGVDQRRSQRAIEYWLREYHRLPRHDLPVVGPELTPRLHRGVLVSPALDRAARLVAARHQVTTSTVLLAGLTALTVRDREPGPCGFFPMAHNRFRPDYAQAVANIGQIGFGVVDLSGRPTFADLLPRVWQSALDAYRHAYYDAAALRRAFTDLGYDYGSAFLPYHYFNDVRLAGGEAGAHPTGETEAGLRAATQRSTFSWVRGLDRASWHLLAHVVDEPGAVGVTLSVDTRHVLPDDVEPFLRDLEELLVRAAFRDVPWPWSPRPPRPGSAAGVDAGSDASPPPTPPSAGSAPAPPRPAASAAGGPGFSAPAAGGSGPAVPDHVEPRSAGPEPAAPGPAGPEPAGPATVESPVAGPNGAGPDGVGPDGAGPDGAGPDGVEAGGAGTVAAPGWTGGPVPARWADGPPVVTAPVGSGATRTVPTGPVGFGADEPVYAPFAGGTARTGPLTWGQRAMWRAVVEFESPERSVLNLRRSLTLSRRAAVDVPRAVRALGDLVGRHESLRTRIRVRDGELCQVAEAEGRLPISVWTADAATDPDGGATARTLAEEIGDPPFDHAAHWPMRAALVVVDGLVRHVVVVFSHSTVDFHAAELVLRDLRMLLLRGRCPTAPGLQSLDVAERERTIEQRRCDRAVAYWSRQFGRLPVATVEPAGAVPTPRYRRGSLVSTAIDPAARLVAARHRVTTSTVLLAATAAVIAGTGGQEVCGIFSMANNRFQPEYATAISKLNQLGFCLVDLADRPDFAEVLARTGRAALDGYRHAYYDPRAMEKGFADIGHDYGTALAPFCFFNDIRLPVGAEPDPAGPDEPALRAAATRSAFTWLNPLDRFAWRCRIQVVDAPGAVELVITADTRYLPPDRAERLLRAVEELLVEAAFREVPWPWLPAR